MAKRKKRRQSASAQSRPNQNNATQNEALPVKPPIFDQDAEIEEAPVQQQAVRAKLFDQDSAENQVEEEREEEREEEASDIFFEEESEESTETEAVEEPVVDESGATEVLDDDEPIDLVFGQFSHKEEPDTDEEDTSGGDTKELVPSDDETAAGDTKELIQEDNDANTDAIVEEEPADDDEGDFVQTDDIFMQNAKPDADKDEFATEELGLTVVATTAEERKRAERQAAREAYAKEVEAERLAEQRAAQRSTRRKEREQEREQAAPKEDKQPNAVWLFIKYALSVAFKSLFILVCIVAIVVSFAAVKVSTYMVEATANDSDILDLTNLKLSQTSYIRALNPHNPNAEAENDWINYQELTGPQVHRIWVPLSEIPDDLIHAVIAIEDREFETHHGVSFKRTIYAFLNEMLGIKDDKFGASTIDQQLVKNLTGDKAVQDDDGDMSVGYERKLREIYRAWNLNNNYSKDMIMEAYLNTMSLSEMLAGVQAGAKEYFNKDVSELSLAECATIAGITRSPTYYSPFQNPDNALKRRDEVLNQMAETGYITVEEARAAKALPLGLIAKESEEDLQASSAVYNYFVDTVFNEVKEDLMVLKGWDESTTINYIYTAGLKIDTTVDWKLQDYVQNMYETGYNEDGFFTQLRDPRSGLMYKDRLTVKEKDAEGNVTAEVLPQSAISIIDYNGSLKAVAGGIGEKTGSLELNRAVQSPRQVGSTMKPVAAYALGIEQGIIDYGASIVDSPYSNSEGKTNGPKNWPGNFSLRYRNTGMPVVSAIAESTNTVAVKVGAQVGIEEMFSFLRDTLQISSLVEEGNVNDMGLAPLVLGAQTIGISTYELAGAYMMFGNGGQFNSLHSYVRVRDRNDSIVLEPEITSVQAISEETAFIMNRLLHTVLNNGEAPGVSATAAGMTPAGEMDAVAKTGTTNKDVDRWFVGLTPYYVGCVWWGYDDNHSLQWSPGARGNIPSTVWKTVMEYAQEGLETKGFPEQPETVEKRAFCQISGNLASAGCPPATGYYNTKVRVPAQCPGHAPVEGEEGAEAPPA